MSDKNEVIYCVIFGFKDQVIVHQFLHLSCAMDWVMRDYFCEYTARLYSLTDFGKVLETWERTPATKKSESMWIKTNDRRKLATFEEKFK